MINKQTGNMYPFVVATWGAIIGKCSHNCGYCYMKRWGAQKPIRLSENALKDDLYKYGKGMVFVGSSTDVFAEDVPKEWIYKTLEYCAQYSGNEYLFQTKNPKRMAEFMRWHSHVNHILAITIETDIEHTEAHVEGSAPQVIERAEIVKNLYKGQRTMISIEPVMKFSEHFLQTIITLKPELVAIGADSGNNNLPEPTAKELTDLINGLKELNIKVIEKKNLKRLQVRP